MSKRTLNPQIEESILLIQSVQVPAAIAGLSMHTTIMNMDENRIYVDATLFHESRSVYRFEAVESDIDFCKNAKEFVTKCREFIDYV